MNGYLCLHCFSWKSFKQALIHPEENIEEKYWNHRMENALFAHQYELLSQDCIC